NEAAQQALTQGSDDTQTFAYDLANMRTVYDFVVQPDDGSGLPNMQLVYENVALDLTLAKLDEQGYLDLMLTQFKALEAQGMYYSLESTETAVVGEEIWTLGKFSLNDGTLYQDFYLRKVDGIMFELIVTYVPTSEDKAKELTDLLVKVK
ncbi:MAG: hypothetical protein LBC38_02890, partial [Oscillospiraceae bacterium]|nr:hypothetical protein [Oscillospiraceae bacterium]